MASKKTKSTKVPVNTVEVVEVPKEKPSCNICTEQFNKVANTKITCPYCSEVACRRCIQTYITGSTNDPHCMHCKKLWEREFLDDNLTMTYRLNEYKKHRENVLLDREVALLPSTQYRAEQMREAEKLEADLLPPFTAQLQELYKKQHDLQAEIDTVNRLRMDSIYQIRQLRSGAAKKEREAVAFIRKCPDGACRGFLSSAWKCGLCSKWACHECHEIKGDTRDAAHECTPENIATAKLLTKDTKPCPGCGVQITKIEGCDQMWCPQCHTAFSWKSGRKEVGAIHNPHFYEWQRRISPGGVAPRVAGDMPCGGIPPYHTLRLNLRTSSMVTADMDSILSFHRIITHIQHVDMPRYHNVFNPADNEDLRIQYLLGTITSEYMKSEIQKREKRREKERAIRRALEVLVQVGTDIIQRILDEQQVAKKVLIAKEIDSLRIYVNELLVKIHDRLKLSVHQYSKTWNTEWPFSAASKKEAARKEASRIATQATNLEPV